MWSIVGGMTALSAHIQVDDRQLSQCDSVLAGMTQMLRLQYHLDHSTIQLECPGCETTHLYCDMGDNGKNEQSTEQLEDGLDVRRGEAG